MHTQFFIHPSQFDDHIRLSLETKFFEQEKDDINAWSSNFELNDSHYQELLKCFKTPENNHKHFMIIGSETAWAHPYPLREALKGLIKIQSSNPAAKKVEEYLTELPGGTVIAGCHAETFGELFRYHTSKLNNKDLAPPHTEIGEAIIFDADSLKTWKTHPSPPTAK